MLDMGFEPQIRRIVEGEDMPRAGASDDSAAALCLYLRSGFICWEAQARGLGVGTGRAGLGLVVALMLPPL